MKEKRKHKLKVWLATIGFATLCGVIAIGSHEYSRVYADNETEQITTITKQQANYNTYTYLTEQLETLENDNQVETSYIMYNNNKYEFTLFNNTNINNNPTLITWTYETNVINFDSTQNNKFILATNNGATITPFNYNLEIYSDYIAENIYAPLQPDNIIVSITSGLGLITSLANQFLTGFTALFWQNNTLTNFAIWSLVFLGIAISFSIIRLIYNVISKNTGV